MRKLVLALLGAVVLLAATAAADARPYRHHGFTRTHVTYHYRTYRPRVSPVLLGRLRAANQRLAWATYRLRQRLQHRHHYVRAPHHYVRTPYRQPWRNNPLLNRKSG